jgi:hypothetical protein
MSAFEVMSGYSGQILHLCGNLSGMELACGVLSMHVTFTKFDTFETLSF